LIESYGELRAGSISRTLEIVYIIKLLILQQKEKDRNGLQGVSTEMRNQLIRILSAIQNFKEEDSKDEEGSYITSVQEFAIAVQLRD